MQRWRAYNQGSGFKLPSLVPWSAMGGTLELDLDGFLLRGFYILRGMCPCGPVPPPLKWPPFPPLVAAVSITLKGAE